MLPLVELNIQDKVTLFTMSDFGRTLQQQVRARLLSAVIMPGVITT
jgi:hypothetical protein